MGGIRLAMAGICLLLQMEMGAADNYAKMLEVREMPYHLGERLEGVYSRYNARWFGGPTYVRTDAVYGSQTFSTYGNLKTPVFVGPFCTNIWNGAAGIWCFAQCDEDVMSSTKSVMLPCGQPYPDGTECPPSSAPEPLAPSSQVVCEVLGHAASWRSAARNQEVMPPAAWWRMLEVDGGYVDAQAVPTGPFVTSPRKEQLAVPGERFHLRRDGTFRASARPSLCLGAEGGQLSDDRPLVLWDCGRPPLKHETFRPLSSQGGPLRLSAAPSLCAVAPGGAALHSSSSGFVMRLGTCNGKSRAGQPVQLFLAEDGTVRASQVPTLCLRGGGLDTPSIGDQLTLRVCNAVASQAVEGTRAGHPQAEEALQSEVAGESKVLQMLMAMQERLEQALEASPRLDRLELQLANLQATLDYGMYRDDIDEYGSDEEPDFVPEHDEESSCDASNASDCW